MLILGSLVLILPNIYFLKRNRKQMKPYYAKMAALGPHFSGQLSKVRQFIEDEPCFIGHFSGHKFTLTYSRPEGQPPNNLQLKCHVRSSSGLRIFAHSIPSKVLFDKQVITGDPDMDRYDFYSNKPDEAKRYLRSRKIIYEQLIKQGWRIPVVGRWSIITGTDVNHTLDPEDIKAALKSLIALKN